MDITGVASPRCSSAEPQIGDLGFDMFGKSFEVTRIGTEARFSGQIRVLYLGEKPGGLESGSWMRCSDFTANEHDAKRQRLFVRGGMTDFFLSMNIGNHFLFKSCFAGSRLQVLPCRQTVTSPALQAAGYATVIASICSTERVRVEEGYSCNMIRDVDTCKNVYVYVVPLGGTAKFQEFVFFLSARRRK